MSVRSDSRSRHRHSGGTGAGKARGRGGELEIGGPHVYWTMFGPHFWRVLVMRCLLEQACLCIWHCHLDSGRCECDIDANSTTHCLQWHCIACNDTALPAMTGAAGSSFQRILQGFLFPVGLLSVQQMSSNRSQHPNILNRHVSL